MTPYIDFFPEESFQHEDAKLRPDVVLRMPGDRQIVIEAPSTWRALPHLREQIGVGSRVG